MYRRSYVTVLFIVVLLSTDSASASLQGLLWTVVGAGTSKPNQIAWFLECWASTTFGDGTTLTLAEREDGNWYLRYNESRLRLAPPDRHDTIALVDYSPQRVLTTADVTSETQLEFANLEQISLLRLIEMGT